ELYCEIAARLVSLPAGEPSPLRKQSRKRHEAVVPIVIARHRINMRRFSGRLIGGLIRRNQSLFVYGAARGRIDFVAAEDQHASLPSRNLSAVAGRLKV